MHHWPKWFHQSLIPCFYSIYKSRLRPWGQPRRLLCLVFWSTIPFGSLWAQNSPANPRVPTPSLSDPAKAARAFDSLLSAGKLSEAKTLCTGQMLRMFDFIAKSQSAMAGAIDTTLSKDTTFEEKSNGSWAYLKIASHLVFTRPMMGLTEMHSIQAIHLFHSLQGWRISDLQELTDRKAIVQLRTGIPEEIQSGTEAKTSATPIFPVSLLAPAIAGEIDRMQYRLRRKDGGSLTPFCVLGPEQKLIRRELDSSWILENRQRVKQIAISTIDVEAYLSPNAFLILDDTLLVKTAFQIVGAEKDPTKVTRLIYSWVSENMQFKLGAVLFGNSYEILRSLKGDCSEAAILTAALLRVQGVPARLAFGFASAGRGVFIGHAWTEAFLETSATRLGRNPKDSRKGRWVGVDAALRQFPAGVERVKLFESAGDVHLRVGVTNLMIAILSNLDIEILAGWKQGKATALQKFPGNANEGLQFWEEILKGVEEAH